MNHCIHGAALLEYCPVCEFDCQDFERWIGLPLAPWDWYNVPSLFAFTDPRPFQD